MNILYCTYYDLTKHSPGLDRIFNLRNSLTSYGINIIVVGSGLESNNSNSWKLSEQSNHKVILFNKNKYKSFGFTNYAKDLKSANNFYNNTIDDLIILLDLKCIVIYSPFFLIVKTILNKTNKKLPIIADCGEYFNFSLQYFLQGVLLQQFFFKKFLISKLSGLIVPSPMWYKLAKKLKKKRVFIPGIIKKNQLYRRNLENINSKLNIVFLGSLNHRELPSVIFDALTLCIKEKLMFNFKILGSQKNRQAEYWIKKLKKYKDLKKHTYIYGFVKEEKKLNILMNSDIFIMLRPNNNETKHLFPSRVPELMSSANPIILTKTSSLDFFFKENHGVKFISDKNSPKELSKSIIDLANNPKKRFDIGQQGRIYANQYFSYNHIGKKLSNFFFKF